MSEPKAPDSDPNSDPVTRRIEISDLTPRLVQDYLERNPDYFLDYPEALEPLDVRHASGPAVSILEQQVRRLRTRVEESENRMRKLLRRAGENERLMTRLHSLTLELLGCGDFGAFMDTLNARLLTDFNTDEVRLAVYDDVANELPGTLIINRQDSQWQAFERVLSRGQSKIGRISRAKMETLFGDAAENMRSVALIPITDSLDSDTVLGLLAIASNDRDRFFPGMGSLFLDLLANVISQRLAVQQARPQRKSA